MRQESSRLTAFRRSIRRGDYKVLTRYPVPGTGGWDYVTLDSRPRRLYISHATQVEVLDADSGKVVGTIPDTPGVHGIAIAPAFKHGFTSNGRENKVSMFDPATLKLIKKIDVGKGPDGIYYDPGSKRVFTNNHGSHDISAIDAATGEVVGTVKLEGDGEQAVIGRRRSDLRQQRGYGRGGGVRSEVARGKEALSHRRGEDPDRTRL